MYIVVSLWLVSSYTISNKNMSERINTERVVVKGWRCVRERNVDVGLTPGLEFVDQISDR